MILPASADGMSHHLYGLAKTGCFHMLE